MKLARNLLIFTAALAGTAYYGYKILQKPPIKAAAGHGGHGGHSEAAPLKLSDAQIEASKIELLKVAPQVLNETKILNGIIQANQERVVHLSPRFPGVVKEVKKRIGDKVEAGEILARIESNQSLTIFELTSPLSGTVIERQAARGEYVSEQKPTFIIANLNDVWADFTISRKDLARAKLNTEIVIDAEDGGESINATLSYISPIGNSETQTLIVRAVVKNEEGRLKPGLFVNGVLKFASRATGLAVKATALQTLDNKTVVFVRNGDKFEPREVETGDKDKEFVEILFGLFEGDIYAANNSFILKAEAAKGAASHDH